MAIQPLDEEAIFKVAAEIPSQDARAAYLLQVCAADEALMNRVLTLLRANDESPSFLESPAGFVTATLEHPTPNLLGTQIGPYKLREQIGEGGMGVVYVAEQTQPVQRKVALKIIKPGMASRDVVARFEAERQALAMMDHPNIAKVFDAGAIGSPLAPVGRGAGGEGLPAEGTAAGDQSSAFPLPPSAFECQPYFVMELVQGPPITEYCDEHKLNTRERLELFEKVCRAVQHAHQKGVIHRDLKPSNVLVPRIDGKPVPKVIDFGVAKAVGQKLTEQTVYTQFSQLVGTPLYMSPEQAEFGVVDIDTRSDVYSLGVLLYELLTGSTPFDSETLKQAGFDEMRRIIREEEPLRPSARVSTLAAQALSTVADRRGSDPRQLGNSLVGELDWLVMKALEKDRGRRYESASSLAADVERYLAGQPVEACPPSSLYRFKKFAARNKGVLTTVAIVLVALLLGITGTSWQAWRAHHEAKNAEAARQAETELLRTAEQRLSETNAVVNFLVNDLLAATRTEETVDEEMVVNDVLAEAEQKLDTAFTAQPLVEATIRYALGRTFRSRHDFESAAPHLARAVELRTEHLGRVHPDTLESIKQLAEVLRGQKKYADAQRLLEETLQIQCRLLGSDHLDTIQTMDDLAEVFAVQGNLDRAEALHKETLEIRRRVLGPVNQGTLDSIDDLAGVLSKHEKYDEARRLYEDTLEICRQVRATDDQTSLNLRMSLAQIIRQQGDLKQAQKLDEEVLEYLNQSISLNPDESSNYDAYFERATLYARLGSHEKAEQDYHEAIRLKPDFTPALINRSLSLLHLDRWGEAMSCCKSVIKHDPNNKTGCRAKAENILGWILANCPDSQLRDTIQALRHAQKAVELRPNNASCWNTLGLAQYRAGEWRRLIDAANTSIELSAGQVDGSNGFLLAIAHAHLSDNDEARKWFELAVQWTEEESPDDQELQQLRAVAEVLMFHLGEAATVQDTKHLNLGQGADPED